MDKFTKLDSRLVLPVRRVSGKKYLRDGNHELFAEFDVKHEADIVEHAINSHNELIDIIEEQEKQIAQMRNAINEQVDLLEGIIDDYEIVNIAGHFDQDDVDSLKRAAK